MCWKRLLIYSLCATNVFAQSGDKKGEVQRPLAAHLKPPAAPALSPGQALQTFKTAPGFKIELVASEPMVQDPVAMTFDEDGRIWVVEMRGFMPALDGTGENAAIGRISVLEDAGGNERRSVVFLDNLILPRAIARVKNGVLFVASGKLSFAQDTDGDGKADQVTLVDPDYVLGGNLEHQPNGLMQAMDNWFYNANSQSRYRFIDGHWSKQKTEFRGQWGISQDDYGRLFYNVNDSQLRADIAPPGYMSRNPHHKAASGLNLMVSTNQHIFPIRMNTGVNRGYRTGILDEQGHLLEFTSASAPLIYRGDNFPPDCYGNAFVCESAANLIKRNIVFEGELRLTSKQAYADSEFLASTDERFRPVNTCNAPDGALYVVDMYRGIIQHRAYITTHLRNEILARDLEKPIHLGRIYRVVHTGKQAAKPPRLSGENSMQLIQHLSHPNGWWRDTAQRLLVERQDQSIVPALIEAALNGTNHLGRLHALWTLEGLRFSQPDSLLKALDDPDTKVQIAAVRVLESMAGADREFQTILLKRLSELAPKVRPEVEFQIALALGNVPSLAALAALKEILLRHTQEPLFRDAVLSGLADRELEFLHLLINGSEWSANHPARASFLQSLASAIIKEGRTERVEPLLGLVSVQSGELAWRQTALLVGMAMNANNRPLEPIRLLYPPLFLQALLKTNDHSLREEARKVETLLAWPGHEPVRPVRSRGRPLTKEENTLFTSGKELYQQTCFGCHGSNGEGITPLAPPLANSEWVLGSEERLVRIVLHGLEGPVHVNGTKYEPPLSLQEMPALGALDDSKVAGVLTFIRRSWGHDANPVLLEKVSKIRKQTDHRRAQWTEAELSKVK